MARQITASVGINGKNILNDVITVQELLNNVPEASGGPKAKLKVDGICGPKTREAIQAFQLKHFGWSLADGRVDPGKNTLAKLNEYDLPKCTRFKIRRNWDMPISSTMITEYWYWFFEVFDDVGNNSARYYFGDRNDLRGLNVPHASYRGNILSFQTLKPYAVTELACAGRYTTYSLENRNLLHLTLLPQPVIIEGFPTALFIPSYNNERTTFDKYGEFILVS